MVIKSVQIKIKKELPFDSDKIEDYFQKEGLDVLRWAVVKVTEKEFIIDAAIVEN